MNNEYFQIVNREIQLLEKQYNSSKDNREKLVELEIKVEALKQMTEYPQYALASAMESYDELKKYPNQGKISSIVYHAQGDYGINELASLISNPEKSSKISDLLQEYQTLSKVSTVDVSLEFNIYMNKLIDLVNIKKLSPRDPLYVKISNIIENKDAIISDQNKMIEVIEFYEEKLNQATASYFTKSDIEDIKELSSAFHENGDKNFTDLIYINVDSEIDFDTLRKYNKIYTDYHFDEYLKGLIVKRDKISKKLIKTKKDKESIEKLNSEISSAKLSIYKKIGDYYKDKQQKFFENNHFTSTVVIGLWPSFMTNNTIIDCGRIASVILNNIEEFNNEKDRISVSKESIKIAFAKLNNPSSKELDNKMINIDNQVNDLLISENSNKQIKTEQLLRTMNNLDDSNLPMSDNIRNDVVKRAYMYSYIHQVGDYINKEARKIVAQIIPSEDKLNNQVVNNNKQMGYTAAGLLGFIAGVVSIGIIVLGVMLG